MEFVAAVSHELRTPLAVICSAGENLADGVVADRAQIRRYGALIETEGRRLADMVERVMEFAGINVRRHQTRRAPTVDLDAGSPRRVTASRGEARDRGVDRHVRAQRPLPASLGDADALRSAVQNVDRQRGEIQPRRRPRGVAVGVAGADARQHPG